MPNILAHCLVGEIAIRKISNDKFIQVTRKYPDAFLFGLQGPDSYFFYHCLPWQNQKKYTQLHDYGSMIHASKVNDAFTVMIKNANNDVLLSYVLGYIAHHALDSWAHPYINYSTGSLTKDMGYSHQLFEAQIDLGIAQTLKIKIEDYDLAKKTKSNKVVINEVANLNQKVLSEVFGCEEDVKEIAECFYDMNKIEKMLYDPKGKRYRFVEWLENVCHKPGRGTSMMVPLVYDNKLDAMNYRKDKWLNPVTKQASNESFEELFYKAVNEIVETYNAYSQYLDGRVDIKVILDIIGNRSYDNNCIDEASLFFKADEE